MLDESLAYKNSFIHSLDPVARILASLIISVFAATSQSIGILTCYLILSTAIVLLSSLSLVQVYKRLKPLIWFLIMIWIILPLTFAGEPAFTIWKFDITKSGLMLCGLITIKSIAILLIFTSLIATMTITSLGNGLHRMHMPDKLILILLMTFRYIFVIEQEYKRLLRAAKFRGFVPGTNYHSYRTFAYLIGMIFVRASFRAKRVYDAMTCRGFQGKFHAIEEHHLDRSSLLFLFTAISLAGTLASIEIFGRGF